MTWKGFFYLLCGTFALLLRFLAMTIGAWFIMDAVGVKVSGEGLCLVYAAFVLFYFAQAFEPWFIGGRQREDKAQMGGDGEKGIWGVNYFRSVNIP